MTKETHFYKLDYIVGQNSAQHFVGARWNVEEFEWDPLDPSTYACEIKMRYECTVPSAEFNVDCWPYAPHVCGSQKLIDLLDLVGARYRAIPFDLVYKRKARRMSDEKHYIVLLLDNISMMDSVKSEYEVMLDFETGKPVPAAPSTSHPRYEKIHNFVFRGDVSTPPLYSCTETGWIMVNDEFIKASQECRLNGPTFVEIKNGIQYDAFEGI